MSKYLTIPETAERLKRSERTVWRYVAAGVIPSLRLGKLVRVPEAELEATLNALISGGLPAGVR